MRREPVSRPAPVDAASAKRRGLVLAIGVVLVGVALRLPALFVSILNEDEALYSAGAAALATGEPLYQAVTDNKPPGIFWLYRAACELVGRYDLRAIHALTLVWVLVAGGLVARVAMLLVPIERRGPAGLTASLLYFVYTTVQEPRVLATQPEILFTLPLAGAAWMLCRAEGSRSALAWTFGAGALSALATVLKLTAISFLASACLWFVVVRPLLDRRRPALARVAALVAGFAAIWVIVWRILVSDAAWDDFLFWALRYNALVYVPGAGNWAKVGRFVIAFLPWMALWAVPWWLAVRLVVRSLRRRDIAMAGPVSLLAVWTVAATLVICVGGRYFDQYFPAAVPPLAILAGASVGELGLPRWQRRLAGIGVAIPALLAALSGAFFEDSVALFDARRPSIRTLTTYIDGTTARSDRIFVWGMYPAIYVDSDRLAGSRWVGCQFLTGYGAFGLGRDLAPEIEDRAQAPGGFDRLIDDLERRRPALFIDTAQAGLGHMRRYPLERYPRLSEYVRSTYRREVVVEGAVVYRRRAVPLPR